MQNSFETTTQEDLFPPLLPPKKLRKFLEKEGIHPPTEGSMAVARSQNRSEFEWTKINGRIYYYRDDVLAKLNTRKYLRVLESTGG